MARKSRRKGKSRRNTWIALAILAILVVSAGSFYAYSSTNKQPSSTTSSSTSVSSSSGAGPYAVLDTSQGTIVIELFPQDAPKTVANFESLADSGFYNDLVWHRIVAGFVIQTGDPNTRGANNASRSTWGSGGSGTSLAFEDSPLPNDVGYVAMANTSPGGNGASSQFYINLVNNTSLNGGYTVFGEVIEGMNAVNAIAALPVYTNQSAFTYDQPINANDALLISVTIQSSP